MAALRKPKRQVPDPAPVERHQSVNPMFAAPSQEWSDFRQRVFYATLGSFLILIAGALIYGPWFKITDVQVQGTRLLDPHSVERNIEQFLNSQRWLILPNRTLWIMSASGLQHRLEKLIRTRLSVESVTVRKLSPHGLLVIVAERTPVATWTNGPSFGSIDRQGIIIETRTAADPQLPLLRDEAGRIFAPDMSVVKPEVMVSFLELVTALRQANIDVKEYIIPDPVCPTPIVVPTTNTNTAANVNSAVNLNVNRSPVNLNVTPEPIVCDREALRYSSQELHVQLKDGPRVLFDRHSNVVQAVQALKRILADKAPTANQTVDVRFGDRVYIK